jgi:hypothetical protein
VRFSDFRRSGQGIDGRLDYLYHLLDLMEYVPNDDAVAKESTVDDVSSREVSAEERPLRVIDM